MESEQAERILKTIADSLEGGKEFVVEQAPDVVQQLILWGRVRSVGFVLMPLFVTLVCFWIARMFKRKWDGLDEKERWKKPFEVVSADPHIYGFLWVVSLILGAVLLLLTVAVAFGNLQVWLAPKVYVLEYLAEYL